MGRNTMKTEIGELLILENEGMNHATTWHIVHSLRSQKRYVVGFKLPIKSDDSLLEPGWQGFSCTCPRFKFGGLKCKHVDFVEERSQLDLSDWPF